MRGHIKLVFFAGLAISAAGCTLIEFDRLVPSSKSSVYLQLAQTMQTLPRHPTFPPFKIHGCTPPPLPPAFRSYRARVQTIRERIAVLSNFQLPRELSREADPVVRSILNHVDYISTAAAQPDDVGDLQKPFPIMPSDFFSFTAKVTNLLLRRTPRDLNDALNNPFFSKLELYYDAYIKGKFVSSFAQGPVPSVSASLAIDDNEIAQAVTVFVELILDEALKPVIWYDTDVSNNIYPGENPPPLPTYIAVNGPIYSKKFESKDSFYGCGMNLGKAKA